MLVYPHVLQHSTSKTRMELRRSMGRNCAGAVGSEDCGEVAELNTVSIPIPIPLLMSIPIFHRLGFVPPCRSSGGGSPIPQQLSKKRRDFESRMSWRSTCLQKPFEAKTKVFNGTVVVRKEGAEVVKLLNSTGAIIM